jgi:hypothetical protein
MRSSTNLNAQPTTAGSRALGITDALAGRDIAPQFEWRWDNTGVSGAGSARQVKIAPMWSGAGNGFWRVPWWHVDYTDATRPSRSLNEYFGYDEWTIDLTSNAINTVTFVGGVVDGVVGGSPYVIAESDLLVWAFFAPDDSNNSIFKGFAATHRPAAAYTTHSNGAKGSTTTFTLAGTGANRGRLFRVGSRVLVREGTTLDSGAGFGTGGSRWNHGTITAVTNTTIIATLDNKTSPSAVGTALTAATAGTIIQTNNFEPRIASEDSIYPGGGIQYAYAYIGNLRIDANQNIASARHRGDIYYLPTAITIFSQSDTTTTAYNRHLGRVLPSHIHEVEVDVGITLTAGAVFDSRCQAQTNSVSAYRRVVTPSTSRLNVREPAADELMPFGPDTSIYIQNVVDPGATVTGDVQIRGWIETEF